MIERIFVDSNIWVYLFASDDVNKNACARSFIAENSLNNNILVISYQVLNEVAAVLKTKKKLSEDKIQFVVETMFDLCIVQDFTKDILLKASSLRDKHSVSYWDSLIVATALGAGCNHLSSEDMQHGQTVYGLKIRNIFHSISR
jgi:predicted nucleic acid-binding protein